MNLYSVTVCSVYDGKGTTEFLEGKGVIDALTGSLNETVIECLSMTPSFIPADKYGEDGPTDEEWLVHLNQSANDADFIIVVTEVVKENWVIKTWEQLEMEGYSHNE